MPGQPITYEELRESASRLLGVGSDEIAPGTNLIALGLDSIILMSLVSQWRKQGVEANFAELAAHPTLGQWLPLLRTAPVGGAQAQVVQPISDPSAPFALGLMQHAQWAGRSSGQRLGGVAAHAYIEFDGGSLDPVRLGSAVEQLLERHPMLRVQILPDGTQQVLDRPALPVFAALDLTDRPAPEVERRLAEIREEKSSQQVRVDEGQVIDVLLVLLPGGRSRLCMDMDISAADAMSYRILMSDLVALYQGETLEPVQTTYREYLERKLATPDPAAEADRIWWNERLAELPPPPELPITPGLEFAQSVRSVSHLHVLSAERKAALFATCHAQGVTPAMALASVFAATIANWSGSPKFLLNLPLFTRDMHEQGLSQVVGDFSSSVLLDVDFSEPATVVERARDVQRRFHAAAAHSAYPGVSVLRDLSRFAGEQVIAPVIYTSTIGLGELYAESVIETFGELSHMLSQGPQIVLDVQIAELGGNLILDWHVREPLLQPGVVEAMFAWYVGEIERLAASPAEEGAGHWSAPSGAGALPEGQRAVREALHAPSLADGQALHSGFFEHAEQSPDATAVIAEDGTTLSYDALRQQVLAVAGALVDLGVKPGDAVAVALPKGARQVPALLGVHAAGGVYVPVGVDQPDERRQQIAQRAGVVAAITAEHGNSALVGVPQILVENATQYCRPLPQPVPVAADDFAYVLFTSGSTGVPKGVEMRHGAPMNTIAAVVERFEITGADRCLSLSPLECDWSVFDIFGMLSVGGSVVVIDEASRIEPARWAELIRQHEVTYIGWMPGWLDLLLDASSGPLPSLRVALAGGDWVSADLPRRLRARALSARFAGLGGATETAIHSTVCEAEADASWPPSDWRAIPFGVPLPGVRCRVVDPRGAECPDWVVGEYWVGGEGIAAGYRGDPERTAERFVLREGERWYRTADLARRWPDGTVEFVGRADNRVKVRGYGVELGEVETALRGAPGVARAVAAALDGGGGELGRAMLAAAVSPEAGAQLDAAQIRAALELALPAHMIPEIIVTLDEMPLTKIGKLDRAGVRQLLLGAMSQPKEQVEPRTSLEAALVRIIFGVVGQELGVEEDFFRFGVDSILAIKAVAQIREGLDVPSASVADFFGARTIAGLARRLQAQDDPERVEQVAELYLEIDDLSDEELLASLGGEA